MPEKHTIKVCLNINCCQRGSGKVRDELVRSLDPATHDVVGSPDCFRFCKSGPNVAVDGKVIHHVSPWNAKRRVEQELRAPSVKKDALGTRSIDALDDVLDELTTL